MTTDGYSGEGLRRPGVAKRLLLVVGLAAIVAGLASASASASVNFTKQWIGASEFFGGQYMAADPASGDIYIVDSSNNRVLKLDSDGAVIGRLGIPGVGGDPGQFNAPEGIAVDSSGNVYVSEAFGDRAGAGTYRFYTRAKDKAGNYEMAPSPPPDAATIFSP